MSDRKIEVSQHMFRHVRVENDPELINGLVQLELESLKIDKASTKRRISEMEDRIERFQMLPSGYVKDYLKTKKNVVVPSTNEFGEFDIHSTCCTKILKSRGFKKWFKKQKRENDGGYIYELECLKMAKLELGHIELKIKCLSK